ncbi:MAG: N-formylglutamate amidohydrolase [Acidimicrobiales bacterium]|nr:N-formylglutamate amidohydrolase [Hyphomonadaceae bacterium]RZV44166.1 MAG: N-formylglutamate amidohydrolase [Acidimicrobiales bacterium]
MSDHLPFVILPAKSNRPVFCFCDHATNHIPGRFDQLGMNDVDLQRHIAWDIGAETLTRQFCETFGAAGLLARYSRLLIDPNRDLASDALIPQISDGTIIPGNQNLTDQQRQHRIDHYYEPYHEMLEEQLDLVELRGVDPLIVSIHSFTPKPDTGDHRQLDIGLLWKVDENKAIRVKAEIERIHPYNIELNEPYSALKLNHTMDRHVVPRGWRHITLEVRQDLIDTEAKALLMAERLSSALRHFIKS